MKTEYVEVIKCPVEQCDSEEFQTTNNPRTLAAYGHIDHCTTYESNSMCQLIKCKKCGRVFSLSYGFEYRPDVPDEVWEEK